MLEVIFQPAAVLDLREAHDWYEERTPNLGAGFLESVEACVERIRRHPEIYPAIHRRVRQGVVARFPYSVLYLVADDHIAVISVFHSSRDPRIWKRRL